MTNESAKDRKEIAVNDATIGPAMRQAVREALERHRQAGVEVVLYENGKTVWRDAGEVLAELDAKARQGQGED
jgi:hypothetical protein